MNTLHFFKKKNSKKFLLSNFFYIFAANKRVHIINLKIYIYEQNST